MTSEHILCRMKASDNHCPMPALQVVVTEHTAGPGCTVRADEILDGKRRLIFKTEGYLGRSGVTDPLQKSEGDGYTPAGRYVLGLCFGLCPPPAGMQMPYRKITEEAYWDCDPCSASYNRWVSSGALLTAETRRRSEHLAAFPGTYDYCIEVCYNTDPVRPGKGSAIFLHCTAEGGRSTAGCIAAAKRDMRQLLICMRPKSEILILPKN